MVNPVDLGHAVGHQSREDQARARAQVRRHHRRARQTLDSVDDGQAAFLADVRPQAVELGHVDEAVRVDLLGDDADAIGQGQKHRDLALKIGGKARIRQRRDIDGAEIAVAGHLHGVVFDLEARTRGFERVDQRREVLEPGALHPHFARGQSGADHEGAGLDSVGHHPIFAAAQFADAFDGDHGRARAPDTGPARVEVPGQIGDLRFAGGMFDHRGAAGQGGRHHDIGRAGHRRSACPAQVDAPPGQVRRLRAHVPPLVSDFRAEGEHAL